MSLKEVWRVHAYCRDPIGLNPIDEPNEDGLYPVYDHTFTSYARANKMYEIGEKTMGVRFGVHWHLTRMPVDCPWAQEDMANLASELTNDQSTN